MNELMLQIWDEELNTVEEYEDENGELVVVVEGGFRDVDGFDVRRILDWAIKERVQSCLKGKSVVVRPVEAVL